MSDPSLPLAGLVAVEIGHSVAGPFAGMILAELGAEVVKIENPENGDDARSWGPPFVESSSALFKSLNRNKKSAALDLKDGADHADLRAFVRERADIVLQNMRPGTVDRLGLGADALRREKPSLIYCNMGAYGASGPLSRHPGYDPLMQAFGGIMSVTGEEGRDPVRVGPSLVDQGTGMWAVIGILAALHRRQQTGEGCVVDTSLFETAVTWVGPHVANYLASGAMPRRLGTENPGIAPYKAFAASDGWLIIAAGNNALFRRAAEVLGHPEWAEDPAFATNADRVTNRERLNALVAEIVAGGSRAHWLAALEAVGVPCAPMQTIGELVEHEQLVATGILQSPPEGRLPLLGLPVQMDGVRPAYRSVAPALGADTGIVRRGATETTP